MKMSMKYYTLFSALLLAGVVSDDAAAVDCVGPTVINLITSKNHTIVSVSGGGCTGNYCLPSANSVNYNRMYALILARYISGTPLTRISVNSGAPYDSTCVGSGFYQVDEVR